MERDPNAAMVSAAEIMPSIEMPGVAMPYFRDMADVVRRAGIYGPRDYLRIVEELIRFWAIEAVTGLDDMGRKAQEKIMAVPARLLRVADMMETRSRAKTFSFDPQLERRRATAERADLRIYSEADLVPRCAGEPGSA